MNTSVTRIRCPKGTVGLVCKVWGDIYGVAANWADASSPVLSYGEDGWEGFGKQVADFRHDTEAALKYVLKRVVVDSGDEFDDKGLDSIIKNRSFYIRSE